LFRLLDGREDPDATRDNVVRKDRRYLEKLLVIAQLGGMPGGMPGGMGGMGGMPGGMGGMGGMPDMGAGGGGGVPGASDPSGADDLD